MLYFAHTYHNAHMKNACMLCKCCRFVTVRGRSWPFTNVVMQMPSIRGRLWLGLFATSWRSSSSSYRQNPTKVSRLGVRLQIWCDITRTIDNVVLLLSWNVLRIVYLLLHLLIDSKSWECWWKMGVYIALILLTLTDNFCWRHECVSQLFQGIHSFLFDT